MTQPTHDEVMAYTVALDEELDMLIARYDRELRASQENDIYDTTLALRSIATKAKVSNLTNRAGLERHKPQEHCKNPNCTGPVCSECGSKETVQIGFPCPTYTEIYNQIRSVM